MNYYRISFKINSMSVMFSKPINNLNFYKNSQNLATIGIQLKIYCIFGNNYENRYIQATSKLNHYPNTFQN